MKFIADLHIHSHYSIATSKNLIPEYLDLWARLKGINVIGTGDAVHPGWLNELKEKLEPVGNGLYQLKKEHELHQILDFKDEDRFKKPYFILTSEISSIYKKNDRVRKVHNLLVFPDFDTVEKMQDKLEKVGNIRSDGRPILGLDSKILLEYQLETSQDSYLIPAHIWTPWFSVLGSKSGFDTIEECYEDLTGEIFAVETGLSSDPAMNWTCSFLDSFKLVSNSDAHSPEKIGREANLFDGELSYSGIYNSLKGDAGFLGTIEFHPQEGKYHYDGHRKCNVCWDPLETIKHKGICPVCSRPVTKGVMYRVAELADRANINDALNKRDFHSITQLPDILAEIFNMKSSKSRRVTNEYMRLIKNYGPEFNLLLDADLEEIKSDGNNLLAEAIRRLRNDEVYIEEGFDGEFGRIKVFNKDEVQLNNAGSLFNSEKSNNNFKKNKDNFKSEKSVKFDIKEFKELKEISDKEFTDQRDEKSDSSEDTAAVLTLSVEQKDCVVYTEGNSMIIAGPGSGKTRILTERIIFLVNELKVNRENIIAITFSNKAADEIHERIKFRLDTGRLRISTFHSFGLSIIKEFHKNFQREKNILIIDDETKRSIIEDFVNDKKRAGKIMEEISLFKQDGSYSGDIDEFMEMYNQKLQEINSVDIDDLIFLPVKMLRNDGDILNTIREKYKWILVDEFQDVNAIQYELIKLLTGKNNNLFVIGDPDQAIYGFRGADVRLMERLRADFPAMNVFRLKRSYRCPEYILKASSQVLGSGYELVGRQLDIKIQIQEMNSDKSEADWIAATVEKMIGGTRAFSINSGMSDGESVHEALSFSDFAVLCRSSFMFDPIIEAFNNHGVPYQVIRNKPFYFNEPYKSAIDIFRSIYTGQNESRFDRVFFLEIIKKINDGEPVEFILDKIMESIDASENEKNELYSFSKKYNTFDEFLKAVALRQGIDDYDDNAEAVSVMTMHAAKGLEFNNVFIPGCETGIIPFTLFNRGSDDEINEEKRLFYVGVTRTKINLFLTHAGKRLYRGRVLVNARSPFIDAIEKELINTGIRKVKVKKKDDDQLDLFT